MAVTVVGAGPGCPVRQPRDRHAYRCRVDEPEQADTQPKAKGSAGIIAIGVAIGLLLVLGMTVVPGLFDSDSEGESNEAVPPPTVATTTTSASDLAEDNGDAVDLVVAYGRSRTDDHALTGELLRVGSSPVAVRRAIMGGRAIDEVGATAAVTEDGKTRQCELLDGQWLCAPPLPAITAELDVQGFATLLLTEQPTYSVFAVSAEPPEPLLEVRTLGPVTCWSMVSDGRVDRARFGAETTMCFHDELGALVGRVTETSAGDNIFLAYELWADVEIADVEPSR